MIAVLWVALGLLLAVSMYPKSYSRLLFGGSGWIALSIYLVLQTSSYIEMRDYFNAFLVIAGAAASLLTAYIMVKARNEREGSYDVFISLSRAASLVGLIYFLFAAVDFLNAGLISLVTSQTVWVIEKLGFPVAKVSWNQLAVNGFVVEIILACTAIESIALFSGLILSASEASFARKFRAFMISVPVIYLLNLQRVSFTASASGLAWFGTPMESFHISEHFIAKIGSLIALLFISYMVLKILPEISDMIHGIWKIIKIEFSELGDMI